MKVTNNSETWFHAIIPHIPTIFMEKGMSTFIAIIMPFQNTAHTDRFHKHLLSFFGVNESIE